jgi:TatD DNase family protein
LETDAPYLAPVPKRGHPNLPEYLIHTAKAAAALKNVSLAKISNQTTANFKNFFEI